MESDASATEPSPLVSVVIATRNRAARCARLLELLGTQTLDPALFEVIVVDDGSTDETPDVLAAAVSAVPFRLRSIRSDEGRGQGPARNLGWQASRAPIIAFTDDDCAPVPAWLGAGAAAFDGAPEVGVVQGRTVTTEPLPPDRHRRTHYLEIDGPNVFFETCNIFYRREALEAAGGFSSDYTWWSAPRFEDTEAGWAALEAGWTQGFADAAVVAHDIELRPMKWWVKTSLSQYREIAMAARFPAYRRQVFWRRWAPTRGDAAFVTGVAGAVAATRWRPALLAAVPYLVWRRPSVKQTDFLVACAEIVVIDAARAAGNVYGAIRHRTFVV